MSKTTPEEAIVIAMKYGVEPRGVYPKAFLLYPSQLAALIDEVIQKTIEKEEEDWISAMKLQSIPKNSTTKKLFTEDKHYELSGFGSTGNNPEQSGDSSLPIDMAPNEEDEAIRAKELSNIPWTGYLHPAPREDSDT